MLRVYKKILIFYYTQARPKYPLGDQECWPEEKTLTITQSYNLTYFTKRREKPKLYF
jgi:hypothetical protein